LLDPVIPGVPKPRRLIPPPIVDFSTPQQDFAGMSQTEVEAALGAAHTQIERHPGQLWVYQSGTCKVELLFLLDVLRNDKFVADWTITGIESTPQNRQRCLRRIERQHAK